MILKFTIELIVESSRLNTLPRQIQAKEDVEQVLNIACTKLESKGYTPQYTIPLTISLD